MIKAAAGFVYLFGDHDRLSLRVVEETPSTITLGWDPLPGIAGYRFSREGWTKADGSPRFSVTWDPSRSTVKFGKGSKWYRVEALASVDNDTY